MSQEIDLNNHEGLIFKLAYEAAKKYGGRCEDWLGPVYEAISDAKRTFKSNQGATFSTHAVGSVRWKLQRCYLYENKNLRRTSIRVDGRTKGVWLKLNFNQLLYENHCSQLQDMVESPNWISNLSERDQQILRLRLRGNTYKTIGQCVGLSVEGTRNVIKRLIKLRTPLPSTPYSTAQGGCS